MVAESGEAAPPVAKRGGHAIMARRRSPLRPPGFSAPQRTSYSDNGHAPRWPNAVSRGSSLRDAAA
eukprot:5655202-Lingulodinium_polyedra.AAC.1